MRGFCREVSQQQGVEINLTGKDLISTLSPEISLCLYRVLQEALHNAIKHSGARQFDVDLFGVSNSIHLTIHDAGVGFDPKVAMQGQGLGLTSMQERMKLVNGKLSVTSETARRHDHSCLGPYRRSSYSTFRECSERITQKSGLSVGILGTVGTNIGKWGFREDR